MYRSTIEGVLITPLNIINGDNGDVFHAMKMLDPGYSGFGEAYFSSVNQNCVKGWKRHREMTLNLVPIYGEIRFVIFDDRNPSVKHGSFMEVRLSRLNYFRLTIPPGLWCAFQGIKRGENCMLNLANIPHDPNESDNLGFNEIKYQW